MEFIQFNNGLSMPKVGLGLWATTGSEVIRSVIDAALDVGYRHFDCAYVYHNENEVGDALKEGLKKHNLSRSEIFVTSKLWITMMRPENVKIACKNSLSHLKLGYLDLYLIHWPMPVPRGDNDFPLDSSGQTLQVDNVPHSDTWKAMEALVDEGLVKSIGLSNFNQEQIEKVLASCKIKPANLQIEVHANFPNLALVKYALDKGIAVTAYSPLGSPGFSLDKYKCRSLLDEPWVKNIAEKVNRTCAQVLLRYTLQLGCATIPKSANPKRVAENFKILDFTLSEEDMSVLSTHGLNKRMINLPAFKGHPEFPFAGDQ